ncbi:MAG TPA: Flp family type IVb pilin [Bryobacteraceae bacterium]|nr:Flp family type IVb pilin [Bryobacteraceae bacterium]
MRNFWKDESGQDLVEYALVVGIMALGTVALMQTASASIIAMWTKLNTALTTATAAIP